MTPESPERTALRGLLLALVEVQNMVRSAGDNELREFVRIQDHVESDHVREYVQLARAVLDTPAESGWQPIETAPKDGTQIIGFCSKHESIFMTLWEDGHWGLEDWDSQHFCAHAPTHWMPLPPPPASPRPIPAEQAGVHV